MMTRYADIVFLQGDDYYEAEAVADAAVKAVLEASSDEGFIGLGFWTHFWPEGYRGCSEWVDALLEYLKQWDYGDVGKMRDEPSYGYSDGTYETDDYILSWNFSLGYASLQRKLPDE